MYRELIIQCYYVEINVYFCRRANSCRQLISKIENEQGFMTADPAVRGN